MNHPASEVENTLTQLAPSLSQPAGRSRGLRDDDASQRTQPRSTGQAKRVAHIVRRAHAIFGALGGALSLAVLAALWSDGEDQNGHAASVAPAISGAPESARRTKGQESAATPLGERLSANATSSSDEPSSTNAPVHDENELLLDPEQCFASMMSDEPDLRAVTEWAERFAHAVEVDPASIEVDPHTGRVKGRFEALAGLGTASFAIEGSRFEVSIWPRVKGPDSAQTPLRSMMWNFENDGGAPTKPGLFLQNHPNTAGSVHDFVGDRAERIVGWGFTAGERGAVASPTVVRMLPEEPGAWIIGQPQSTPGGDWPGYFIDGSHKVLLGKLAPYAKH